MDKRDTSHYVLYSANMPSSGLKVSLQMNGDSSPLCKRGANTLEIVAGAMDVGVSSLPKVRAAK